MTYHTYQCSLGVKGWVKGDLQAKDFRTGLGYKEQAALK